MEITIELKDVYGQRLAYPVCVKAKIFAELTGKKTLTSDALRQISRLGYEIKVKPQPTDLPL